MPQDSPLPSVAGWYPDPYAPDSQRWFDGSEWTVHAVSADSTKPDQVVESAWKGETSEELRRQERFSSRDLSIPQDRERPYDGAGGWQGLYANRVGRGIMRSGMRWGPLNASRWIGGLTLLLALCAWGDPAHRPVLASAAVIGLVATVVAGIREARQRAYWRKVGRTG